MLLYPLSSSFIHQINVFSLELYIQVQNIEFVDHFYVTIISSRRMWLLIVNPDWFEVENDIKMCDSDLLITFKFTHSPKLAQQLHITIESAYFLNTWSSSHYQVPFFAINHATNLLRPPPPLRADHHRPTSPTKGHPLRISKPARRVHNNSSDLRSRLATEQFRQPSTIRLCHWNVRGSN